MHARAAGTTGRARHGESFARVHGYSNRVLEAMADFELVQESYCRSIDIQQEVEVATQSTPRKGLRSLVVSISVSTGQRQKPPVARARNRDSEASRKQQAPAAKKNARRRQVESYQSPRAKRRRTWLVKKDVEAICRDLMLIKPEEILPKVISRVDADATHLYTFPERDKLWKHVRSSEALCELLRQLIVGYVKLYKIHNKGKDKYAHFLVAWHELFSHFAVEGSDSEDTTWYALICERI